MIKTLLTHLLKKTARPLFSISLLSLISLSLSAQDSLDISLLGRLSYNQTINDVWGWVDTTNNKEYALVGVQNGLSVVDVTNPANPTEVRFFPGASSIWRDMKTFGNYAYTVHDVYNGTGQGVFIVDMTTLGQQYPLTWEFKPSLTVGGQTRTLERAHNLYIDEQGFMYLFGANIGAGGALIFDLNTSATSPTFAGAFDTYYLHDGVARGDTLWGAAVLDGFFLPIDVSNKSNPTILATQNTPFNFTHNIWFSDDNQRVFTTDERTSAYIGEYDVSDLNNITELDRLRTSFGTNVIPHNAHFYNNFLVNSYYTAGVQIVDVSQPGYMVETGYYDTSQDSGDGFGGCWGAYPYLPSGNILATDRQEGLFVLQSDYSRGCYVNISVVDSSSGRNLINAQVDILGTQMQGATNIFGNFKDGQAQAGTYQVEVSRSGFVTDTFSISLAKGVLRNAQFALLPLNFSVEQNMLDGLSWYPNVGKGPYRLEGLSFDQIEWSLSDAGGRTLDKGSLKGEPSKTFDWSLDAGIYFLDLHLNGAFRRLKLFVP